MGNCFSSQKTDSDKDKIDRPNLIDDPTNLSNVPQPTPPISPVPITQVSISPETDAKR